jgi:hypothetical protein
LARTFLVQQFFFFGSTGDIPDTLLGVLDTSIEKEKMFPTAKLPE